MQFKGRLKLPGDNGEGIAVDLRLEDVFVELVSDGEELGRWRVDDIGIARLYSNQFSLDLAGEEMVFVADDALGFAYEGISAIEDLASRLRKRRRPRIFARKRQQDAPTGEAEHLEEQHDLRSRPEVEASPVADLPGAEVEEDVPAPAADEVPTEPSLGASVDEVSRATGEAAPSRPSGPLPAAAEEPGTREPGTHAVAPTVSPTGVEEEARGVGVGPAPHEPDELEADEDVVVVSSSGSWAVEVEAVNLTAPDEPAEASTTEPPAGMREAGPSDEPAPRPSGDVESAEWEQAESPERGQAAPRARHRRPRLEVSPSPAAEEGDGDVAEEGDGPEQEAPPAPPDEPAPAPPPARVAGEPSPVEQAASLGEESSPQTPALDAVTAEPSQAEPSQAEPSQAEPIQMEHTQARSGQAEPEPPPGGEEPSTGEDPPVEDGPTGDESPEETGAGTGSVPVEGNGHRKVSLFARRTRKQPPDHVHRYEESKTVGGITRRVCSDCGHVSFAGEDVYQGWS